ncbi:MAG: phosphatase PAP2 family protein [Planctomycetota bacterium]
MSSTPNDPAKGEASAMGKSSGMGHELALSTESEILNESAILRRTVEAETSATVNNSVKLGEKPRLSKPAIVSSKRIQSRNDQAAQFKMASLLWMAGICLLMAPMATLFDVPLARWFSHNQLPNEIADALDISLMYAHGSGIFLILVSVILLAPRQRWHVPRLAALALGAGAVATLTKTFVLRPRPTMVNLDLASYDFAWIWSFDWTLSQVATFDSSTRSFPSATLATATALTVGLWIVLPRGRWMFTVICVGTMLQRLHGNTHFLSDLFGSAAVGLSWAYVCYHPRLMGTLFDKMEPEQRPRRRIDRASSRAIQPPKQDRKAA